MQLRRHCLKHTHTHTHTDAHMWAHSWMLSHTHTHAPSHHSVTLLAVAVDIVKVLKCPVTLTLAHPKKSTAGSYNVLKSALPYVCMHV